MINCFQAGPTWHQSQSCLHNLFLLSLDQRVEVVGCMHLGRRPYLTVDCIGQGQLSFSWSHSFRYFEPCTLKGRRQAWLLPQVLTV